MGICEESVNGIFNFNPIPGVDAIVEVRDNEVVITIYDNGTQRSVSSDTTGIPATELTNVTLDVETESFAPGSTTSLIVLVNGTAIPSIDFICDG